MEKNKVDELFIECVASRIETLGYRLTDGDAPLIKFESMMVYNHVLIETNLNEIPSRIYLATVNMAALDFLSSKKMNGSLEGFDFEPVLKQISEGDTNMSFNTGVAPEERFDLIVKLKRDRFNESLVAFRRMVW